MIDNPMVAGLGRHYAQQDRRDSLAEAAYRTLRNELIDALMHDPAKSVQTPGFKPLRHTAAEVINESLAGKNGDQSLFELLRIVGLLAQGKTDHELHLRAAAWIAARAREHAELHHDDMLAGLEEDAA